jgi:hypothetical protein
LWTPRSSLRRNCSGIRAGYTATGTWLRDLDPSYLRFPESREMVGFAEELYRSTNGKFPSSPDYFARLWPEVRRVLAV